MNTKRILAAGSAVLLTAVTTVLAVTVAASPASAATNDFRGFNWADQRDNFVDDTLVLGGLSTADSYATTVAKATSVLNSATANFNTNTVRIPVNYATVSGSYWNSYRGIIDAAGQVGYKIILSYWEAASDRDGTVDNDTQFWSMWQTIVNAYGSAGHVYFEPFNEPYGYSADAWKNLAAQWLSTYSGVPKGRIIISGSGYNTGLITIGSDSRFNGTYISRHTYKFFNNDYTTEAQFYNGLVSSVGSYADRVIITEWGAEMTNGKNYESPSSDLFISFIRGTSAAARQLGLGSVYWPGVRINDTYSMFGLGGSGTNLSVSITNQSGKKLVQHSWGMNVSIATPPAVPAPATYYRVTNVNSGKVMDVIGQSTADSAEVKQYTWNSGANQKWAFEDAGGGYYRLRNMHSGKCLDVASGSTANGANIIQYACGTGTNQQWQWVASGSGFQLRARHSGKCLDVVSSGTGDGADIQQYTCAAAANQQWTRTQV
ncbi:RICIN domain-containing protein [Catellatospora citrea]|uniref:Carbohydrate-binding protein n=1 Tax=Catellatospora citrea TaxID=53366 RepID=A0A8J3KJB0_9ACTN|nr:RICIN domain-containing protein [Catellatospora citrea]RKE05293.1 ricin-type beta-trefoil lectin protein [Catellatospora citrea]GIF98223.1 carbohydrate-binding protein [Catellatospora citrea]